MAWENWDSEKNKNNNSQFSGSWENWGSKWDKDREAEKAASLKTSNIFQDSSNNVPSVSKSISDSGSTQNNDTGFWAKIRNANIEDTPVFKAITSPIDALYKIPLTQRILTTAGNTLAGHGAVKNADGSDMQLKDAGKVGNVVSDLIGTGLGYSMPVAGLNNSLQGAANKIAQPVEKLIPQSTTKLGEYGANALKNGLEFGVLNTGQGLAEGKSIDDSLKSGAEGVLTGAAFGTALKGASEFIPKIKNSAFPDWKTTFEDAAPSEPIIEPKISKPTVLSSNSFSIKNTAKDAALNDYNNAIEDIHNYFKTNQLTPEEIQRIKPELGIDLESLINNIDNAKTDVKSIADYQRLKKVAGVDTSDLPKLSKPKIETIESKLTPIKNDIIPEAGANPLDNLTPGSKVSFMNKEYTLGDKSIDGQFDLLNNKGKAVLSTTIDNLKPLEDIQTKASSDVQPEINSKININELIKNSDQWKDKSPLALQRETWDRNIIDIAGKEDGQKLKEALFDPIHENEAKRIKFMNEERSKIKALNLTEKESEAVQKYGEGKYFVDGGKDMFTGKPIKTEQAYTLDSLKEDFPDSWEKIVKATGVFKDFYKKVLPMANEALSRNGYKPISELDNYFPHFTKDNPILKALGVNLDVKDLPTDINGLTHQFKPGKNWVGNFLHRTGNLTDFGAVEGFDRYIEGASKVIHHTDDIKNLREFTKSLRLKYSPEEVSNEVQNIMNSNMEQSLKDAAIEELLGRSNTQLSNSVADLDEFTNVLAGKKDLADRADERRLGRPIYNISNFIMGRIAKNMVALNPGSWLTNFIPLTQSAATTGKKEFIQAMGDTLKSLVKDDGFIDKSTFLTNREGSDILSKGITDKIGDKLASPMKWIDNFTSQVITRSKYLENIKNGMSEKDALKKADDWASKIMGDRSLGAQPTLFNQKSPFMKVLTQFQLEVNNQMSFLFKDMPREYLTNKKSTENIKKLTSAVSQMALFGFLYNNIYSELTGRRPALDPIGSVLKLGNDLNNTNLKKSDAVTNFAKDSVSQLPFVGGVLGGGRLPISAAAPDGSKMWDALSKGTTGEMDSSDMLKNIGGSLGNSLAYVALPFGAGQLKKSSQALSALNDSGVYNSDKSQLKYPISTDAANTLKSLLFGTSSLKETQDYYDNKRTPLTIEQTKDFNDLVNKGFDSKSVYNKITDDRAVTKAKNNVNNELKSYGLTDNQKEAVQGTLNNIVNSQNNVQDKIKMLNIMHENIKKLGGNK